MMYLKQEEGAKLEQDLSPLNTSLLEKVRWHCPESPGNSLFLSELRLPYGYPFLRK